MWRSRCQRNKWTTNGYAAASLYRQILLKFDRALVKLVQKARGEIADVAISRQSTPDVAHSSDLLGWLGAQAIGSQALPR